MAGTRLSGLFSGMDTESLISQLMESRKTKVDNKKKEQIALQYKQDKWKELNTKLKNLQSKFVSNLRFSSSYAKKTSSVSNTSAASVITGEKAVDGVQSLEVKELAKTGYLTGGQLGEGDDKGKGGFTALTKMSDLGFSGTGNFVISTGGKDVSVEINDDTTISDVLNQFKDAGLNASFDAKNQRFFISSKESGKSNDFSITATNEKGDEALTKLGLKVSLKDDAATLEKYEELAKYKGVDDDDTKAKMKALIDAEVAKQTESYQKQYDSLNKTLADAQDAISEITKKYESNPLTKTSEEYQNEIADLEAYIKEGNFKEDETKETLEEKLSKLKEEKSDVDTLASKQKLLDDTNKSLKELKAFYDGETGEMTDTAKTKIADSFVEQANYAAKMVAQKDAVSATGATKVNAADAKILLNNAEFTNSTNVFEINGLTITALSKTDNPVTITTQNDVSGIYDMVKNFLKEYNSVINEIDKLYNAASIGSMKPMTSEEKDAVSESEATEWEKKLRESTLRRDSNLSSISDALRSAMSGVYTVNGQSMTLADFGINTMSYFEAADNEKNMYHIDGDPDDENTSGKADKLKSLISSDPGTVVNFFTQLGKSLYKNMSDISSSVQGFRSYGNFFDDVKLKSDYDSYNSKITELEEKMNDYEDKWYAKFAKMESAMAKMQSNTSAISSMLGGS